MQRETLGPVNINTCETACARRTDVSWKSWKSCHRHVALIHAELERALNSSAEVGKRSQKVMNRSRFVTDT